MKVFFDKLQSFWVLAFLFLPVLVYPAVPIQEGALFIRGASPAQARLTLLATAETFLGVPYRFGGTDRRGMDCSGFVYVSFREALRYNIPRTSIAMYNWAHRIPTSELQPGDLVFFVTVGARVSHVGIYVGGGRFIHSASDGPQTGVIISRLDESFWHRTFRSAGRALPWDANVAREMAAARGGTATAGGRAGGNPSGSAPVATPPHGGVLTPGGGFGAANPLSEWESGQGFFMGAGTSWIWFGGSEGLPTPFRGISAMITAGYMWSGFRLGLELRPQWDSSLSVFRLPVTMSLGTDRFNVFAGPAYIFGEPGFDNGRNYKGGWSWLWEVGVSAALPPIPLGRGALSIFGELAWQSYRREAEHNNFRFRQDVFANIRTSTGIRYLWRL